jgi:hypothetical protein
MVGFKTKQETGSVVIIIATLFLVDRHGINKIGK